MTRRCLVKAPDGSHWTIDVPGPISDFKLLAALRACRRRYSRRRGDRRPETLELVSANEDVMVEWDGTVGDGSPAHWRGKIYRETTGRLDALVATFVFVTEGVTV